MRPVFLRRGGGVFLAALQPCQAVSSFMISTQICKQHMFFCVGGGRGEGDNFCRRGGHPIHGGSMSQSNRHCPLSSHVGGFVSRRRPFSEPAAKSNFLGGSVIIRMKQKPAVSEGRYNFEDFKLTMETFYRIMDKYEELVSFQAAFQEYEDFHPPEDTRDSEQSKKLDWRLPDIVNFRIEQLSKKEKQDFTNEFFETIQNNNEKLLSFQARLETYMRVLLLGQRSKQRDGRHDMMIDLDEYGRLAGLLANTKLRLKQIVKPAATKQQDCAVLDSDIRGRTEANCFVNNTANAATEKRMNDILSIVTHTLNANKQPFENDEELTLAVDSYLTSTMTNSPWLTLKYGHPIGQWDVSRVKRFKELFSSSRTAKAAKFDEDLSSWDVSGGIDFRSMFQGAGKFKGDLSKWDVSNAMSMSGMFSDAKSFDSDISKWNVSKVTSMSYMFQGASSFKGTISEWDVSNVEYAQHMFQGATAFDCDLSEWNVSQMTFAPSMFQGATSFKSLLGNWDTSKMSHMAGMFKGATCMEGHLPKDFHWKYGIPMDW